MNSREASNSSAEFLSSDKKKWEKVLNTPLPTQSFLAQCLMQFLYMAYVCTIISKASFSGPKKHWFLEN